MRPTWEPRPDRLLISDHPFEPLGLLDWTRCSHVEVSDGVGRVCDRPREDHATGPDDDEEIVEVGG